MKKLLAIVLTLVLVLGMSTVAFAEPDPYKEASPVEIRKSLTVNGGVNPAETFEFYIGTLVNDVPNGAGTGVVNGETITAPSFESATFTINVAKGGTSGTANISLPDFTEYGVGVYTYPITEKEGNTAGFDYDNGTYYLVVTVINNPNGQGFLRVLTLTDENNVKDDSFTNSFDAGDLIIKKVITGNYADPNDEFEVTVTLTPVSGKTLEDDAIEADGSTLYYQDPTTEVVTITYTVTNDSEYTIKNIPYDVNYTVVETNVEGGKTADGYTVTYDNFANGEINALAKETTITNERKIGIETGINLDSLPYLIILAVAIGGLILFVTRRRMASNE